MQPAQAYCWVLLSMDVTLFVWAMAMWLPDMLVACAPGMVAGALIYVCWLLCMAFVRFVVGLLGVKNIFIAQVMSESQHGGLV